MNRIDSPQTSNGRIASSQSKYDNSGDVLWTAARCRRLLQRISSCIDDLRKITGANRVKKPTRRADGDSHEDDIGNSGSSQSFPPDRGQTLVAFPAVDPEIGNDPPWLSCGDDSNTQTYENVRKARLARKRHYSATVRLNVSAPTYLKHPLYSSATSSEEEPWRPQKKLKRSAQLATSKCQASDGLFDAFRALLLATEPTKESTGQSDNITGSGASSLVNMCLRKVPDWIGIGDEDEGLGDGGHGSSFGNVSDTYHYLEEMFSVKAGGGWPGLRLIVRAHGVKMILDAISDRELSSKVLRPLLVICKKYHTIVERRQFLRASFYRSSSPISDRVRRLVDCCTELGCKAFLFQFLCELLDRGLFWDCNLCEHIDLSRELVETRDNSATRPYALSFFEAYALECIVDDCITSSKDQVKRTKILRSLAIDIIELGWTTYGESASKEFVQLVERVAFSAYQIRTRTGGDAQPSQERQVLHNMQSMELFWIGSLLLNATDFGNEVHYGFLGFETLADLLLVEERIEPARSYSHMPAADGPQFFCEVARSMRYFSKAVGQDLLKSMVTGLLKASKHSSTTTANFLNELAVNSAWVWAQHCGDDASHVFAEGVARFTSCHDRCDDVLRTPTSTRNPTRYRWEDGLGEWIAKTPIAGSTTRHADTGGLAPADIPCSEQKHTPIRRRQPLSTDVQPRQESTQGEPLADDDRDELALDFPLSKQPSQPRPRTSLRMEAPTRSRTTERLQTQCSRVSQPFRSTSSGSRALDPSDDELGI